MNAVNDCSLSIFSRLGCSMIAMRQDMGCGKRGEMKYCCRQETARRAPA
jgi:hypothetical protein